MVLPIKPARCHSARRPKIKPQTAEEGWSREGFAGGLTYVGEQRSERKIVKMKKGCAESTPLRSRSGAGLWNAWRHGQGWWFISAGGGECGHTSDGGDILEAACPQSMRRATQGIRS